MTEIRIRNVDDWIVDMHRHNAKKTGISLQAELRRILTEAALAKRHAKADKLEAERKEQREQFGDVPSTVPFIRTIRDGLV